MLGVSKYPRPGSEKKVSDQIHMYAAMCEFADVGIRQVSRVEGIGCSKTGRWEDYLR